MGVLTSTLVLKAEDRATTTIGKLARSFDGLSKSAQAAGKLDTLNKSLAGLRTRAEALDRFRTAHDAFAKARTAYAAAQADVERLARAIAAVEKPTAAMRREFRLAQDAVRGASSAFQDQKTAVLSAKQALEGFRIPVSRVAAEERRLQGILDRTNAHLRRREALTTRAAQGGGALAAATAGAVAGASGKTNELGQAAIGAGATALAKRTYERARDGVVELDAEQRRQRAIFGFNEKEQKPLERQAMQIGQATRYSNADIVRGQTSIGQRLQKSMQDPEIIAAIAKNAEAYAVAMDSKDHPVTFNEAAEAILSRMVSMGYDMSSREAVERSSRHAANRLVQMSKISGMQHHDIGGYLKFGGAPGHTVGFSEEFMDAAAATLKRVGFEGSMAGNFIRAAATKLGAPTRKALDALSAAGVRYQDFIRPGTDPTINGFADMVSRRFGRGLTDSQKTAVEAVFDDEEAMKDQGSFTRRVSEILNESFAKKTRKGTVNAQDAERIAKVANDFYRLSAQGVDAERLLMTLLNSGKLTLPIASALFGQEHGGRLVNLKPNEFAQDLATMRSTPDDRARSIAQQRQQGVSGAYTQMQGAIETFFTRLGQVNQGPLEAFYKGVDATATRLAELPDRLLQFGSAIGAAVLAITSARGVAAGAAMLGVPGAAAVSGALGGVTGAAVAGSAAAGSALGSGGLPFFALWGAAELKRPTTPENAPYRLDQKIDPGQWERAGRATEEWRRDPEGVRGRELMRLPRVNTSDLDAVKGKAAEADGALDGLNRTVAPKVDTASIDSAQAKLDRLTAGLRELAVLADHTASSTASISQTSFQNT